MNIVYQAIQTKSLGPTNTKGTRVKAKAGAGTVTLDWDYGMSPAENHRKAAEALAAKFKWNYSQMITGSLDADYVHTLVRG